MNDTILNYNCKKLLLEYSKTQLTFDELLCNVWELINVHI